LLQTITDHLQKLNMIRQQRLVRLTERAAIDAEQRSSRRVDDHRQTTGIKRDQSRGQTRNDPLAELFRGIGAFAGLSAELLQLLSLLLQLRDDRLKRLEHKLGFVLRLEQFLRGRRALRFAHELVIRTQQPAQEKQHAQQAADQYRDERGEQDWTTRGGRFGREGVEKNRKQGCQQEQACEHRQAGLKAAAVFHYLPELACVPLDEL